jgi:hypothetical protein
VAGVLIVFLAPDGEARDQVVLRRRLKPLWVPVPTKRVQIASAAATSVALVGSTPSMAWNTSLS